MALRHTQNKFCYTPIFHYLCKIIEKKCISSFHSRLEINKYDKKKKNH